MKRKIVLAVLGSFLVLSLSGCGGGSNSKLDNYQSSVETEGSSETAQTEKAIDPEAEITGYLAENAKQYVTLCDPMQLKVEKPVYTVSDDDIQMEIENSLYEYATLEDVDRPIQEEDVISADVTATRDGEDVPDLDETDYTIEIGYEEFGSEFDQMLIGCKAGDSKEFDCSFTIDNAPYDDWIDQTVHFTVKINSVQTMIIPEYNDDFAKLCGFDNTSALEDSMKASISASYEEESMATTIDNVLTAAVENSEFSSYPDKLYESAKESVEQGYASFAEWFGMTLEEMYEAYGMSDEDLKAEVLDLVYRRLLISAICQEQNLTLTEGEYQAYLDRLFEQYGFSSAAEMEETYGKDSMVWSLYEEKAAAYLLDRVAISEVEVSYDDQFDLTDEDAESIEFDEDDAEIIEFDEDDAEIIEFDEEEDSEA